MESHSSATPSMPDVWEFGVKVVLSPTARLTMFREAQASEDGRETGGVLLGFDPDPGAVIVITQAGDPGPKAIRRPDFFNRDLGHAQYLADSAFRLDHSRWVGDWHTHPAGGSEPSWKDMDTYNGFLDDAELQFGVFLAVILTPDAACGWERPDLRAWVVSGSGPEQLSVS